MAICQFYTAGYPSPVILMFFTLFMPQTRQQGSPFLTELKQKLLLSPSDAARAGTRYNVPLINSLVLYVGMQVNHAMLMDKMTWNTNLKFYFPRVRVFLLPCYICFSASILIRIVCSSLNFCRLFSKQDLPLIHNPWLIWLRFWWVLHWTFSRHWSLIWTQRAVTYFWMLLPTSYDTQTTTHITSLSFFFISLRNQIRCVCLLWAFNNFPKITIIFHLATTVIYSHSQPVFITLNHFLQ